MFEDGIGGYGDMAYDIVPQGMAGWGDVSGFGSWGDMAYDIVPAPDQFGLEGYSGFGAPSSKGSSGMRRQLKRLRKRRRALKLKTRSRAYGKTAKKKYRAKIRAITIKIRRIKKALSHRPPPPAPPTRYVPIRPKLQRYRPIRPVVQQYRTTTTEDQYSPLEVETEDYVSIDPPARQYAPLASEEGAESYPVVRLRQTAPATDEYEDFDEYDDDWDEDDEDNEEAMEGFGGYGAVVSSGKFKGVTATMKNYRRNLKMYRKAKSSPSPVDRSRARIFRKRIKNIERKNAHQIRTNKRFNRSIPAYQLKLQRYIRSNSPFKRGRKPPPPPPPPGAGFPSASPSASG